MGAFTNNAITENGRLLLADAQTGGEFVATKIVMGSGYIPAGKTSRTMTDVVSPVKNLVINKIERTNDGKVIIGGAFSNEDITTEFYFRELALYARCVWRDSGGNITKTGEEKLYSYGNAGAAADLIPAYSTSTLVEKQMDLVTYVGNDTIVNLTIESGMYLTVDGDGKDLTVTFAEASTRENITVGEKLSTMFGKIAKWFADLKTVAFTGSYTDLSNKPESFPPSSHTHSADNINSGVFPIARGGTGASTAAAARTNLDAAQPYHGTVTLAASSWSAEAPYSYSLSAPGMTIDDNPYIGVVHSWDEAANNTLDDAWAKAKIRGTATTDTIVLTARGDKPAVNIPIFWRGSR
jgi:hypothetical protein